MRNSLIALLLLINLFSFANVDTVCFSNKAISVVHDSVSSARKTHTLFHRNGRYAYKLESYSGSYNVSNRFSYRVDGSVMKVVQTTYPGGSPNHSKSILYFDTDNTPLRIRLIRYPVRPDQSEVLYLWNKQLKRWVKQKQSLPCASVPNNQ